MIKVLSGVLLAISMTNVVADTLQDNLRALQADEETHQARERVRLAEEQRIAEEKADQERRLIIETEARKEAEIRIAKARADAQARAVAAKADAQARAAAANAAANAKVASARAAEEARLRHEEATKAKNREIAYEDQLRDIELQDRKLSLDFKRAKVARANDLIDQEIGKAKAETDVIQAGADAQRNVSAGTKEMLTGIGKGVEAEGHRWFK